MKLTSLHILLTYRCNRECDHCFVWGSPHQRTTLTLLQIKAILEQAKSVGTITSVYFEGGEPFLYYITLLKAVRYAAELGFSVGIVSNAYWATNHARALNRLRPLVGLVHDLSISNDVYHGKRIQRDHTHIARVAAAELGIPTGEIAIVQPEEHDAPERVGMLPDGESEIMYRGRAAIKLTERSGQHAWSQFDACPHENLREPGRVHVDPFGLIHICQGITIGNLFETPLAELCARYNPDAHPIIGPLMRGGPAALARDYDVSHNEGYADACHLCDQTRRALRSRFSETLAPDPMYGVFESQHRSIMDRKKPSPA
ncbi:MAG: radical SAM protein [Chloroflexi bacterium]|nr:radical SAM protein [Chloroflexota bacterium]